VKKIILFLAVAVLCIASCRHHVLVVDRYYNNDSSSTNGISGKFILTRFINLNSNKDNTEEFNGYVFSFGSDGKVTAVKDNQTTVGSYTETHTLGNNLELIFYFSDKPLSDINGNWWVKSMSDTSIELADASTSDVLEFAGQ
jgi:hypothetical protein